MEVVVLSLLDRNFQAALVQLHEAWTTSLELVEASGTPALTASANDKARRVAKRLLDHSFARLRFVMESKETEPEDHAPSEPRRGGLS
jgi:hypothetical protein